MAFGDLTLLHFHHVIVFLLLFQSHRGQLQVIGPSQPVVALVGDDVTLPCRLEPATDASDMRLEWARTDLSPGFVYVRAKGQERVAHRQPSYRGRTSVSIDRLKDGDVSLKLATVKVSDEGTYRCLFPELGRAAFINLIVGAASSPVVQKTKDSSGLVLQCESTGWYPEPEVFWLDGEGNLLSAGPTETVRGPDDLYTVSSRVTVEKRHSNSFTCRVQQNSTNQTRETLIHVPDDFFAGPSGSSSSLPVIIGLILSIVFVLVAAAAVVVWKWRQNKIRNKKQRKDEEGGNSPELKLLMGGDTDGKQPTEETETVNNVDEFRGEPGQSETDEETLQQEANNAQCADSEGTELQFTQEAGGQTTRETETGLDQSQEETETEAVTETDSLHPVSTNLNNKDTKTVKMVEKRQKDNNQQTAEKKGAQSLKEKDEHVEQPKVEKVKTNVHRNNEATGPQNPTEARTPQIEQNNTKGAVTDRTEPQFTVRDGQRDPSFAEGEIENGLEKSQDEIKPVKAEDVPDTARNDPNNKEDENKNTSDNTEKLQEEQTDNKQQTEEEKRTKCSDDETEAQSLTEEDKHGEQQTAEREKLRDREKEHLKKKLKTKERELEKIDRYISRYEEQMKDKEKQINEVKQQLEEVKRQTEDTERKMRSEKEEDYKLLSVLNRKKEELQGQLKKLETQLEGIKKSVIIARQKRIKYAADETEAQSLTEEDKHGEQQTAERETLRDREKEHLEKKLKTKERELEKNDRFVSRYEEQIKDKEKEINEVKQQLEEVKRQTEDTERKMRSQKEEDKDFKLLSILKRKEEELQEQLEKLETQLEVIKKSVIKSRQIKRKATNEKEETKEQGEIMSRERKRRRI